ncbi:MULTISPECIES: hypothetical protein [Olivibacter]|jgi:hypothetical protein|uniref:Uncharacterized protein n=3 Tax=Sphingobacteriaceae TaxID=84566 RepID=F4C651_SPHS2|nr:MULTISPECIES: hypothetical protein [Olivibacter]MDM8172981.1 hypothetical protein [Olivibacter sp. 47]MDX3915589.1 hypothetical protein [Pseudosphingobacterium sp.]QEL02781.1 hypothetical protein FKG96_18820 [Olivibacter sp. LS-1]
MCNNLQTLSILLNIEIQNNNIGNVPYIPLGDRYIVTEDYLTKELELNDLHLYQWTVKSLSEILNFAARL